MKTFEHVRPATIAEADRRIGRSRARRYPASGTNLLNLMKAGAARPDRLIDIPHIAGLDRIEWLADGGVRIGALVRNADLAHDPAFVARLSGGSRSTAVGRVGAAAQCRDRWRQPAAADALRLLRRPRQRLQQARAGLGLQRARRREPPARGAGLEPIVHRRATRPTFACRWSRSTRSSRSRVGPDDARFLSRSLYCLPGDSPQRETVLEPGDLIVALRLADPTAFARYARYLKLRERTSYAFAVVSTAAALADGTGTIRQARLALGGVAAKPWRARTAEDILAGARPSEAISRRAAEAALADAQPPGDNAYKIELARRIVVRTLTLAATGTPQRLPALPASPFSSVPGARHAA